MRGRWNAVLKRGRTRFGMLCSFSNESFCSELFARRRRRILPILLRRWWTSERRLRPFPIQESQRRRLCRGRGRWGPHDREDQDGRVAGPSVLDSQFLNHAGAGNRDPSKFFPRKTSKPPRKEKKAWRMSGRNLSRRSIFWKRSWRSWTVTWRRKTSRLCHRASELCCIHNGWGIGLEAPIVISNSRVSLCRYQVNDAEKLLEAREKELEELAVLLHRTKETQAELAIKVRFFLRPWRINKDTVQYLFSALCALKIRISHR